MRPDLFIKNILNNFDFLLRRNIKFSRGKYSPKNEDKSNLFSCLNGGEREYAELKEKEYFEKYRLQKLKESSTKRNYLENLYIIDLLEKNIHLNSKTDISVLDIGSKNWFYAHGEYNFFKYNNIEKTISLDGLELDAFRLYSNLHSRYDYARYHIKNLPNTRYIIGDLMNHAGKYDYMTWYLPFITTEPLLNWGLPVKYFKPKEMLLKAYDMLSKKGKIIIMNQGEFENQIQKNLLKELKIPYDEKGIFKSPFITYNNDRFIISVEKN